MSHCRIWGQRNAAQRAYQSCASYRARLSQKLNYITIPIICSGKKDALVNTSVTFHHKRQLLAEKDMWINVEKKSV